MATRQLRPRTSAGTALTVSKANIVPPASKKRPPPKKTYSKKDKTNAKAPAGIAAVVDNPIIAALQDDTIEVKTAANSPAHNGDNDDGGSESELSDVPDEAIDATFKVVDGEGKAPTRKRAKLKHAPGETPFPDWPHPTAEECREVERLLVSVHGPSERPQKLEVSSTISGCGEVPSVLDALMRTILSANTSNTNSSRAFQGLVKRFGVIPKSEPEENVPVENGKKRKRANTGAGSVDWDAVRRAPVKELFEAIKCGGLAETKSKNMHTILQQVYEECRGKKQKQKEAEAANPSLKTEDGDDEEDDDEVHMSLDYIHGLDDQAVKDKLTSYKGVGQKTASCVLLFCLQRPSFAVDTHVYRISRFLNWVPQNATRDTCYAHMDLKVPDDIKYSLHNLMIRHGRMCKHCKGGPEKKNSESLAKKPLKKAKAPEVGEDGEPVKAKKFKKIWIGTGMMKEIVVEVEDDGEGGGDAEAEHCILEGLVNRIRKKRADKKQRDVDSGDDSP